MIIQKYYSHEYGSWGVIEFQVIRTVWKYQINILKVITYGIGKKKVGKTLGMKYNN